MTKYSEGKLAELGKRRAANLERQAAWDTEAEKAIKRATRNRIGVTEIARELGINREKVGKIAATVKVTYDKSELTELGRQRRENLQELEEIRAAIMEQVQAARDEGFIPSDLAERAHYDEESIRYMMWPERAPWRKDAKDA